MMIERNQAIAIFGGVIAAVGGMIAALSTLYAKKRREKS